MKNQSTECEKILQMIHQIRVNMYKYGQVSLGQGADPQAG